MPRGGGRPQDITSVQSRRREEREKKRMDEQRAALREELKAEFPKGSSYKTKAFGIEVYGTTCDPFCRHW
jgi:hypothetical protein